MAPAETGTTRDLLCMSHIIVGISAFYHDSAAALIRDGEIVAAAQEERFSRIKHDAGFPAQALAFCLREAGIKSLADIDKVVYYEKPLLKFERLMETHLAAAPRGLQSFVTAMPSWLTQKLPMRKVIGEGLRVASGDLSSPLPLLLFNDHHGSHAAAAFFPSPFDEAAVLCMDGVGEWASSTAWVGRGNAITPLWQIDFPHSVGLLYSAFTAFCGFRVNSGEYKLMGLAPYGRPRFQSIIESRLIDIRDDGSFRLDMRYFDYAAGLHMTNRHFDALFGGPARHPDGLLTEREMDIAASIQATTEKILLRAAATLKSRTGLDQLCLGGGVALNCVANGRLHDAGLFRDIWIQPAPGDAGSAIGAALSGWHEYMGSSRRPRLPDAMSGSRLGPGWTDEAIAHTLTALGARYETMTDDDLYPAIARRIAQGAVVGWFQGRMEFGPRALGSRSLLADPRNPAMQERLNRHTKFREAFRPFAPAVREEDAGDWFESPRRSPYMLCVTSVAKATQAGQANGWARRAGVRSPLPAVTHVDLSARVQTVAAADDLRFHRLLTAFKAETGVPVLINTSFNVRGEPLVCSPEDAWHCFMGSDVDVLVMGNQVLHKADQNPSHLQPAHITRFEDD